MKKSHKYTTLVANFVIIFAVFLLIMSTVSSCNVSIELGKQQEKGIDALFIRPFQCVDGMTIIKFQPEDNDNLDVLKLAENTQAEVHDADGDVHLRIGVTECGSVWYETIE